MNYEHKVQRKLPTGNKNVQTAGMAGKNIENNRQSNKSFNSPKVHNIITTTIRSIVRTALFGAEYTPRRPVQSTPGLESADKEAKELFALYQKIAVAEGAGTGAGGIMLSMVDFPALIAIKMKFLFELAHVYGYDTNHFSERVFILKVFQMTFSGPETVPYCSIPSRIGILKGTVGLRRRILPEYGLGDISD